MVASVERIPAHSGHASLAIEVVSGASAVTSAFATNPLKLLVPRARGTSAWCYTSSFGGGLVAGDQTCLELKLGPGARGFLGTQASTKIYRNPCLLPSGHATRASLGAGSLLVLAPDPVQAFAGSSYTQRQEFHLEPEASLVLLDWLTSGRAARGERWAFRRYQSRNAVWRGGAGASLPGHPIPAELIYLDSLRLDPDDSPLDSPHRAGRFNCLATLLLLGPLVREPAAQLLAEVGAQPIERQGTLVGSASPIRDGALLRLAGEDVEAVTHALHRHLAALAPLLGDDPWARKW